MKFSPSKTEETMKTNFAKLSDFEVISKNKAFISMNRNCICKMTTEQPFSASKSQTY